MPCTLYLTSDDEAVTEKHRTKMYPLTGLALPRFSDCVMIQIAARNENSNSFCLNDRLLVLLLVLDT